MPIDPSIPLQAKGVQLESPVNQLVMANEAMKYGEMNRAVEEQNKLNQYLQTADLSNPAARQELIKYGKTGLAYGKALNEQEKTGLETKKLGVEVNQKTFDLAKQKMADLAFNPSDNNIKAHLEDGVLRGEVTPQQAQATWQAVSTLQPDQRKQYFTELGAKVDERYKMAETQRHNKTTEGIQALAYDPTRQGQIAGARKLAEAKVEEGIAPFKDVQANVKALKSAGYDPVTGTDSISDLIQKSTGSYAGAATDFAGRTVGISTGGAKAIASLKTYESKLTQDLLGGKMGAGISNADRDFIVAGIGQIADPTLPVETRQAAWNSVKERMRVAGMVPAPKGETTPADNPYAKKTDAEIKKELGL